MDFVRTSARHMCYLPYEGALFGRLLLNSDDGQLCEESGHLEPIEGRVSVRIDRRQHRISFEWERGKAARNVQKHRIAFEEACFVFADPLSLTVSELNDVAEARFVTIGKSPLGRLLVVVHLKEARRFG